MAPRVLLDVDPGYDDVLALAVADSLADLAVVTTAAGNAPLEETTRNARRAVAALGIDAAVVPGDAGAAEAIVEHATEGSWILAVAPLTNVAAALDLDTGLAARVGGISIMGGDWAPGADPMGERNHASDPAAADAVARSGARIVRCGLDVTTQVRADAAWIDGLEPTLLRDLMGMYERVHEHRAAPGTPVHDALAVLAVTHPHLFGFEQTTATVTTARTVDAAAALQVITDAVTARRRPA